MSMTEQISAYRIVLRPTILRDDRFCAAMLRRIYLDGSKIEVWYQTYCEADTPEDAVNDCAKKCDIFRQSDEYKKAIG